MTFVLGIDAGSLTQLSCAVSYLDRLESCEVCPDKTDDNVLAHRQTLGDNGHYLLSCSKGALKKSILGLWKGEVSTGPGPPWRFNLLDLAGTMEKKKGDVLGAMATENPSISWAGYLVCVKKG